MGSSKIMASNLDDSVFESVEQNINGLQQNKQDKHLANVVTLTATSWGNGSQTVVCNGVTANNTVIVSPTPDSFDVYGKSKVKCVTQSVNKLTFSCDASNVPSVNLTVNVVVMGV